MKPVAQLVALLAALILCGYVAYRWPAKPEELHIPPGKIREMPGGIGKGICIQGDPNGFGLWYRVESGVAK